MAIEKKVVQTEIEPSLYEFVVKTAKSKGLTLKEATREALRLWAAQEGDLSWDPIFDPSWDEKAPRRTDASRVNDVLYRRRKA